MGQKVEAPRLRDALLVAWVGGATLLPFLGQAHSVSSHETRHAEIAREMAASGDFLIPRLLGQPYYDKLPLMSAVTAVLFRAAGEPSIALARLPSAMAAMAGAMLLYGIGCTFADRRSARLAALGVLGVQGYQYVARNARPDMVFSAMILLACFASIRALCTDRGRGAGFAIAGAACAAASALKGPLAWVFCALFPCVAWLCGEGIRRPRALDGVAFAAGFVAAAATWLLPVLLRDGGAYLWGFVSQPDLTTWHLADSVRRFHWPWLYGAIGLLPLAPLLPIAAGDARRRGLRPALAIALAMLVVLSIIPKKRMHYAAPVLPFLALAVAEAARRGADARAWRAAQALAAIGLIASPLYFGIVLPVVSPGEDAENVVARRLLGRLDARSPIVCFGHMAERLAFVGRRDQVSEFTDAESLARAMRLRGREAYVVLPDPPRLPVPGALRRIDEVESPAGSWRIYRVDSG
jgi:4-amino-4-deoxy-L-arabinose transferase